MADRPDREHLRAIAAGEQARLDEIAVVTNAESVVSSTRIAELAERQKAAYRSVSAARGQLTRARKDGSAAKIAAAAQRLRELSAEAGRIADAGIRESQHLISGGLDNTGALLDQTGRTWDAHAAVTATYHDAPGPDDQKAPGS